MTTDITELGTIDPSWWSWGGAHGGLVAARLLGRARELTADGSDPRSLLVSYLSPITQGALVVENQVVRQGRTSAVISQTLRQEGRLAALATSLFGRASSGPVVQEASRPAVPDVADCAETPIPPGMVPFAAHLRVRPASPVRPFSGARHAEMISWLQLRDADLSAAQAAVVLLDALPPALYAVMREPAPIPSVDLTVHFTDAVARLEVSGWTLAQIRTDHAGSGWAIDTASLWHRDGTLLATARQSRRILARAT